MSHGRRRVALVVMPNSCKPTAEDGPLVFTCKRVWSYVSGVLGLAVGAGCLWLVTRFHSEENAWIPWAIGGFFTLIGLFELLSRARIVFDPATKKWSDRWGVFCFEFHTEGTFSQLEKIRIEKSEWRHGFATYYVWVLGKPSVRILVDSTLDAKKAARLSEHLSAVLELPSAKITDQGAA